MPENDNRQGGNIWEDVRSTSREERAAAMAASIERFKAKNGGGHRLTHRVTGPGRLGLVLTREDPTSEFELELKKEEGELHTLLEENGLTDLTVSLHWNNQEGTYHLSVLWRHCRAGSSGKKRRRSDFAAADIPAIRSQLLTHGWGQRVRSKPEKERAIHEGRGGSRRAAS